MRKIRITLLALAIALLASFMLCACESQKSTGTNGEDDSAVEQASSEVGMALLEVPFESVTLKIDWSTGLFSNPADSYNDDLAIAGLVMAAAANGSDSNADEIESVYKTLGFTSIHSDDYESDGEKYRPAWTMGVQEISVDGETKYLIGITIRGTTDDGDVKTDAHAIVDGASQAGWNMFSNFQGTYLPKCMNEDGTLPQNVCDEQLVLFINGHSLGGGVANVLGQIVSKERPHIKSFVYAYAPIRTDDMDAGAGANLMNIVNTVDSVPGFPSNKNRIGQVFEFEGTDSSYLPYYTLLTGQNEMPDRPPEIAYDATDLTEDKIDEISDPYGNHAVTLYMSYLMTKDSATDWTSRIIGGFGANGTGQETESSGNVDAENSSGGTTEPVGDFVLEGTWESVGDEGFGQAQPGEYVVFDGEHANFFSPRDTYEYKKKPDGTYLLKATSFMFGETLQFRIKVINNDKIKIKYTGKNGTYEGSTTVLKRVLDQEETQESVGGVADDLANVLSGLAEALK